MMVSGKRRGAGWTAVLMMVFGTMPALAQVRANPTAADLRIAAERFDEGRAAFKVGAFVEAAEHFEAADARAPSPSALGLAMRSRAQAGQTSRAATLGEVVLIRHPDDIDLAEKARAIIEAATAETGRVTVDCEPACDLVVDDKLIYGKTTEHWVIYLDPGQHVVAANWLKDRVAREQLTTVAGESRALGLKLPAEPASTNSEPPKVAEIKPQPISVPVEPTTRSRKLSPVYFWVGVGTTAALGAVSLWSGIDTLNNPGRDAVRASCVGQGESCSLYQDGQKKELRTNVLLGTTVVVAIATAVTGIFYTNFAQKTAPRDARAGVIGVRPWIVTQSDIPSRDRASRAGLMTLIGAEGRF